jgi:phage replication-related protein YjqB (UPF0714/DUF867 family)
MHNEYPDFAALAAAHKEGKDFDRIIQPQSSSAIVVIAPHGGRIEPRTDEIAREIAGDDFSLYCFRSRMRSAEANLHITSHRFDDPDCVNLVSKHKWAVAIHGCGFDGERVLLGGLDRVLISELAKHLVSSGIRAEVTGHKYPAIEPNNICNRTLTSGGVQFELSRKFREGPSRARFVQAVRAVLLARQNPV